MKQISMRALMLMSSILIFSRCNEAQTEATEITKDSTQVRAALPANGGYDDPIKWGAHLVTIAGCNDCHTPKKMGPNGPVDNMDLELSGSPSQTPAPNVNRKEIESQGLLIMSNSLSFVGPWGISYAANITSDSTTGIGNWTVDQFMTALRTGKYKGAPGGRNLLPPMPWQSVGQMTDDELHAVFAYLESTKPIRNIVPQPQPPVTAMKK